ncbi:hypothetical protein BKA62DRAFT_683366 [Auriculariales sp. MPI-PUGE-AT-0066]|nr:hypothetical protein BKA62DRAFT_683366 [Auriculariales sp. MPI-PUGE-AT-0066]
MVGITDIPYDIFPLVFHHTSSRQTVLNACLVCRTFAEVSIPALYSTISYSSGDENRKLGPWVTMNQKPQYYAHVVHLTHKCPPYGLTEEDPEDVWMKLFPRLVNLRTYIASGNGWGPRWIQLAVKALSLCRRLCSVSLPLLEMMDSVSELQQAPEVRTLTLRGRPKTWIPSGWDPTKPQADLVVYARMHCLNIEGQFSKACWANPIDMLPRMLNLVRLDLIEMSVKIDFHALLAHIGKLKQLEHLAFTPVLKDDAAPLPERWIQLPELRTLHFGYLQNDGTKAALNDLCGWVDAVSERSPLRTLAIRGLENSGCKLPARMLNTIRSHSETLKTLDLSLIVFTPEHLRKLLESVPQLQELSFSATKWQICETFLRTDIEAELMLEKIILRCHWHPKESSEFASEDAEILMRKGLVHLRYLSVNRWLWERLWFLCENGMMERRMLDPVWLTKDRDVLVI